MDRLPIFLSYGAPLARASHPFYTVSSPETDSKLLENFVKVKRNKLKEEIVQLKPFSTVIAKSERIDQLILVV